MSQDWTPEVTEGEIRDITVVEVVGDPNAKVFHIDAGTKYYEAQCDYGPEGPVLRLYAGQATLRKDETTNKPTVLKWSVPDTERWIMVAQDPGRYSMAVVLYRYKIPKED